MPSEAVPASAHITGLRLAPHGTRPSPARMERFLRRLGIPINRYAAMVGGQSLRDFAKANPTWSQRAWEVMVLENLAALQGPDRQDPRENAPQVAHTDRRHQKILASTARRADCTPEVLPAEFQIGAAALERATAAASAEAPRPARRLRPALPAGDGPSPGGPPLSSELTANPSIPKSGRMAPKGASDGT